MTPKTIFELRFDDCRGWDRLITGMLFQSLGIKHQQHALLMITHVLTKPIVMK